MDSSSASPHDTSVDDILLVLGDAKAAEVKQFREDITSCENEAGKYALCLRKRDDLFAKKSLVQIEFAYYAPVFAVSSTYETSKASDAKWQQFLRTAACGSESRLRITRELKKVAECWGEDFVRHYCMANRGIGFAIHLAGVASKHPDWETDALPRLQQLVRRRLQLTKIGRHKYVHPLERTDLKNAKSWTAKGPYVKNKDPDSMSLPFETLDAEQLPDGFGFDRYGLLVPKDQAVPEPSQGHGADGQELRVHVTHPTGLRQSIEGAGEPRMSDTDATDKSSPEGTDTTNTSPSGSIEGTPETDRTSATGDAATQNRPERVRVAPRGAAEDGADGLDANRETTSGPGCTAPTMTPLRWNLREPVKENKVHFAGSQTTSNPPAPQERSTRTHKAIRSSCGAKNGPAAPSADHDLVMDRLETLASKLLVATANSSTVKAPPRSNPPGKSPIEKDLAASREASGVLAKRPRAASLPTETSRLHAPKRHQADRGVVTLDDGVDLGGATGADHGFDWEVDEAYLAQAVVEVRHQAMKKSNSRGTRTAQCLLPILESCRRPITDAKNGLIELHRLDGAQARALLEGTTPDVPVIAEKQQHFQWKNPARPIPEFFDWIEDHDRRVSVQVPSLKAGRRSYEQRTVQQVRERFLSEEESDDPWNVLDCSCPLPSTLPDFLTGWNCQLLARIRDKVLDGDSAERTVASREAWAEWREIEHWALLSEGGHCTAAHTDSHGLATWITIQEGLFGFAWMSRPTEEQLAAWMANEEHFDEGQPWRYCILKPGQTIVFPSGTIHCVFRVRHGQTLGLGGHILQWSGIRQWMDVVRRQVDAPNSTNEDMTDIWKWVPVIEDLVQKRLGRAAATGRLDSLSAE
jgi:hypothetical protein